MEKYTKETIKIYYQHIRNYKISAFVMVISIIIGSVVNAVTPLYFRDFFNILARSGSEAELVHILMAVALMEAIQWVSWRISIFTNSYFQSKIIADLNETCFKYLHKHSFNFFNNNFIGSLVKKANRFSRSFESMADRFVFSLLPLIFNIIVILIVLFTKNIYLGGGLLAWMLVFMLINWIFTTYKLKYDFARSEAETKASGYFADSITNNVNVKFFRGYNKETREYGALNERAQKLRLFTWNMGSIFEAVQGALVIFLEIGIFYISIKLWKQGLMTIGDFTLIQSYFLIIIMKIWDFARIIQHFYEDLADAKEMTEILVLPNEITDTINAKPLTVKNGTVEFKNVTFNYNETRTVIDNFNLTINPKEKVALVGPSGSGKSTIIKLLMRSYEVTAGEILIDDQNISKIKLDSLWKNIGLVPQDPILFHRSLMENIRYGKQNASDEEVIQASKLARCHEFISGLPEGYKTFVGERGLKLSGGERQRVAIARAILHNSPILILDEATSSLDSESEQLIQKALDVLIKDKTVIVIAHRLSTIMKMDRILVVKDGHIIENGSHKELLQQKNGLYKKLWEVQAGGFIA